MPKECSKNGAAHRNRQTITLKMAAQERSDLHVVSAMILCGTNFRI